jgi:ABC-type bacteriocin/lantibiotic exporter with double-glycine peptidase domain
MGSLRCQIGVVLQSSRLLSGSLFQNIVGSSLLDQNAAWAAAEAAGLADDIRQMPMGMHTMVSEGGSTFSGGQRQRLLIARALARQPRILLFDEATSALDNRTQAIVSRSLERLNATRIVIAHRLSTIQHADRIYVMDRGRIVQTGTYDSLQAEPGLFRLLVERQRT